MSVPEYKYNFHFPDGTMDPGVNPRPGAVIQLDEHLSLRGGEWIVTEMHANNADNDVDYNVHVQPLDDVQPADD